MMVFGAVISWCGTRLGKVMHDYGAERWEVLDLVFFKFLAKTGAILLHC